MTGHPEGFAEVWHGFYTKAAWGKKHPMAANFLPM